MALSVLLETLPYGVTNRLHEAEISKAINDWKVNKSGQVHVSRLNDLLGRNPAADLSRLRKQFEDEFRAGLEEAEAASVSKRGEEENEGRKRAAIPRAERRQAERRAVSVLLTGKQAARD